MRYIELLESKLGKKAKLELLPRQPGDVAATIADISTLKRAVGFRPATPIEVGSGVSSIGIATITKFDGRD